MPERLGNSQINYSQLQRDLTQQAQSLENEGHKGLAEGFRRVATQANTIAQGTKEGVVKPSRQLPVDVVITNRITEDPFWEGE